MTNKEAIEYLKQADTTVYKKIKSKTAEALEIAIKALEQQPCEDCISREEAIACCRNEWEEEVEERLRALPSVTPRTNLARTSQDCISREAVLDVINFEDEWLFDAKSHNADTKIAFSAIKYKISELPSVTPQRSDDKCTKI